jgi:hypothetical protein
MRQSCKCCSLTHCFSRANQCSASRMAAALAHSATNFDSAAGADGSDASLGGAAKCQFSSGAVICGWLSLRINENMMLNMLLVLLLFAQLGQKQEALSQSELLHRSAMRGETRAIEMLLKLGADVNSPDRHGKTPLHDACLKGHVDSARLLLDRGAKIGARGEDGATPLHDAALGGNTKVIDLLLARKADVNARDSKGLAPLDYALKMERSDAIQVLRSAAK